MRLSILLPYSALLALGRALGRGVHLIAASRRRVADINLRLCMPQFSAQERSALVRDTFESTTLAIFETALSWWGSDARLRKRQRIEGLEHLQAARALGRGVILLGGHYTTLEISGRLLAFHTDGICPVYKTAHNPLFDAVMVRSRERLFDQLLNNNDLRALLRSLKEGKIVWYAPDQDFGRDGSVFAPFFGVPTATLTTTARLARLSKAPVLPLYSERLPGNEGFLLRIGEPLANFPSGDDMADATAVNAAIEAQVTRTPAQYLWVHKRFKTRPEGEPNLYAK